MWTATAFCWTTAKNTPVCSVSVGMESTVTISKTPCFLLTMNCFPKLCTRQAESNAKSARHTLCQRRTISGTARTVPPSKNERKPPSASAGNGWQILSQVSGRSPDELLICGHKQSARSDRAENSKRCRREEKLSPSITLFGAAKPQKSRFFQSENAGWNTVIPEHTKSRFKTVTERRWVSESIFQIIRSGKLCLLQSSQGFVYRREISVGFNRRKNTVRIIARPNAPFCQKRMDG